MYNITLLLRICLVLLLSGNLLANQHEPTHNLVSFSVDANVEVDNDILVAVVYTQRDGSKPAQLSDAVNRTIAWAIEQAKAVPDTKVQTQNYNTHPIYKNGALTGWRANQSIRLESRDAAQLSELIGTLQQQLAVQSIGFEVSDDSRRVANENLITAALKRFRERAELVRRELGRNTLRFVRIDVNTSGSRPPRPMMRSMATEADSIRVAAPPLAAGTQEVTVNVSGTIELSED